MTQVHQTIVAAPTASKRWGVLGGFGQRMIASPEGVLGFIVGAPGSGKSAFFQTCPDAFIFNLDPSSTTIPGEPGAPAPQPQALMWPGISPEGRTLDDNGEPLLLTWTQVEQKVHVLKQIAARNEPRPKIVVFDSLSAMIALIKSWLPGKASDFKLSGDNKTTWKELDGRAAWDFLYDRIIDILQSLKAHGYGVHVVGHLVNAKVQLGEDRTAFVPELTITDGFWKRLYPWFEIVMIAQAVDEVVSMPDPRWKPDPKFPNAKPRTIPVQRRRVYLTTGGNEFAGITKVRVPLSTVLLEPASDAWNVFLSKYKEAADRGTFETREIVPAAPAAPKP